jgi:MoaA/NifB/PqqE/SkfB family radical SAM enzyme
MWYFDPPPALKTPFAFAALNIEVTSACNLSCAGCGRTEGIGKGTWLNKHLTKAEFAKIIEHLPPVRSALMQGIGEPTLNPDFLEMLKMAHESGKFHELIFFTNALVRDENYYVEASKYVDHFIISIDTLNAHYVEATRGGTDTEKLKDMVGRILAKGLKFEISMVVSRFNAADVPSTLKMLNDIGPLLVRFQLFESSDDYMPEGVLTHGEYRLLQEAVDKLSVFLPNLTLAFAPVPEPELNNQFFCGVGAPALAPFVTSQGYITPCCRIIDADVWGKASLVDHSFEEIWESPTVRRYVHHFMEKGDSACTGCYQNRRLPLTEKESDSDFHLALERILVPAVNFLMKLTQKDDAITLTQSFFRTVQKTEGDFLNKCQTYYRIAVIFHQLGKTAEGITVLDEITALVGANAEVDDLRRALAASLVPA